MQEPLKNDLNDVLLDVNNNRKKTNLLNDSKIIQIQENLLMMGFDLNMINKILIHFNIQNVDQAIDYLIKSNDGKWNHPFVEYDDKILSNSNEEIINNNIIDNVLNKVKTLNTDLINQKDICQICGEKKESHINVENNIYHDDNIINNNLYNNNILNNNIESSYKKNENNICQICLDNIENEVIIEKCQHKFCTECFENYLNNLINQNNIENIPCPEIKCNNKSLSPDFFSQYITEEQLIKYQNFKTQNEIARDKLKIFCPLCDSFAKIDNLENYNPNNILYKKTKLTCHKGHEFCSCGRPNHEGECYHDGEEFKNLINKEKIKKCPKCGFLIKKNSGCNHMTCGNKACKYEFCWLCLKESLPGHYEFGECEGKQFVDTDSIFYQLEQKYPFLFYVFFLFKIILLILIISLSLIVPILPLGLLTGYLLYDNFITEDTDEEKLFILSKSLSIIHFIICIIILFSIQNIFYLFVAFIILYAIAVGITTLVKSCIISFLGLHN